MRILDFESINEQKQWIDKIRACDWGAAKFLADLLEQNKFHNVLGNGSLFIMADGEKLVSFCTLTCRDCIKDDALFPWIGFVFTSPEYRGKRYSGEVIESACKRALRQGFDKVYLATDHIGLYEKYGFTYMESRTDIYGEESRIYFRKLR
ncbi:MAG: GNAT family N-acetyltransferase [Ruminiclostridium sp.]|nr:GNAT family N-acetyltransferase [Ruminiclostridium sp.]